ncbi:uncharacterized protein LOC141665802 [Apium graveolens]|uniref:uncharacterized protein LOC141665802 n=1 Tax=Apium graveolens TaxID=4045 RepID=UPI003D7B5908
MNALAWNCQGLGAPRKIQFLKDVTRSEKPVFVFLSETISSYSKMEELSSSLGFEGFMAVEPQGRSGGIALFWKNTDSVVLRSCSRFHIDVLIRTTDNKDWRLTGIYGEPGRANRHKTWDLLRNLSRDANLPWCLVGDFNNVTSQKDKKGGPPYPEFLIDGFNSCLHDANLQDLDIIGHQFTWEKGRNTDHWTEVRLDRVLANNDWLERFHTAKVYNLEGSPSDHSPLLLVPDSMNRGNRKRHFRFENAWLTEPACFQIVKSCWEEEDNGSVIQKLKSCANSLDIWGKDRLKDETGNWVDWNSGFPEMIKEYFQKLYTEKQSQGEEVLSCISKQISEQQNLTLLETVKAEEVKEAVFGMHPDKAPGPDGITKNKKCSMPESNWGSRWWRNWIVFQKNWNI